MHGRLLRFHVTYRNNVMIIDEDDYMFKMMGSPLGPAVLSFRTGHKIITSSLYLLVLGALVSTVLPYL